MSRAPRVVVPIDRDMHDGLGPALVTITLQSDTARGLIRTDPDEAEALLHLLTARAQASMGEVRRLIHAPRPPVLDDLGLMHYFATVRPPAGVDAFPELTEREREILSYLAYHRGSQEIADRLGLNVKTGRNHVSNICTKLQVADCTQAIIRARRGSWPALREHGQAGGGGMDTETTTTMAPTAVGDRRASRQPS